VIAAELMPIAIAIVDASQRRRDPRRLASGAVENGCEARRAVAEHLLDLAENRLIVFFAYVAARNPRARFIVYERRPASQTGADSYGQQAAKQAVLGHPSKHTAVPEIAEAFMLLT
jgi:hypothetical protein